VFCGDEKLFIWYFITSKPTSDRNSLYQDASFFHPHPFRKNGEKFIVKLAEILVLHLECGMFVNIPTYKD
jgi:hypothetical protein